MRRIFLILLCLYLTTYSYGQIVRDTIVNKWGEIYYRENVNNLVLKISSHNNNFEERFQFINVNGNWKRFGISSSYENGKLYSTAHNQGDTLICETRYYSNGQILSIDNKRKGVVDGQFVDFYENGQIKNIGEYCLGSEIGVWITYQDNGEIKSKGSYKLIFGEENYLFSLKVPLDNYRGFGQLSFKEGEWFELIDGKLTSVFYVNGKLKK